MLNTIERLREISARCRSGQSLDQSDARWLGNSIDRFLTQRSKSIEDALDLRFPRGGVPWWREAAIRERDEALRQLADRHFPDELPSDKAKNVFRLALRYAASGWRWDQHREGMPENYLGTPREFLWRAFKSGATMPIGERRLRTVLGG
jgi:hypothetical protein